MPRADVQERSVCAGLTTCGSGGQGGEEGDKRREKKGSRFETKRKGFQKGLRMCGRPGGLMIFDLGGRRNRGEKGVRVEQGIRGGQRREKGEGKREWVGTSHEWMVLGFRVGRGVWKTLGVDVEGQGQQGGVGHGKSTGRRRRAWRRRRGRDVLSQENMHASSTLPLLGSGGKPRLAGNGQSAT